MSSLGRHKVLQARKRRRRAREQSWKRKVMDVLRALGSTWRAVLHAGEVVYEPVPPAESK